jgi:hypothetical protein
MPSPQGQSLPIRSTLRSSFSKACDRAEYRWRRPSDRSRMRAAKKRSHAFWSCVRDCETGAGQTTPQNVRHNRTEGRRNCRPSVCSFLRVSQLCPVSDRVCCAAAARSQLPRFPAELGGSAAGQMIHYGQNGVLEGRRGSPRRRRRSRFDTRPTPATAPVSTVRHGHPAIRARIV